MKRVLATTALAALATAPALAQDGQAQMMPSDMIGETLYGAESIPVEPLSEVDAAWAELGEVSDVLLAETGEPEALIIMFGDREIELAYDQIAALPDSDDEGEFFVVTSQGEDALAEAPEFDPAGAEGRLASAGSETTGSETGTDESDAEIETVDIQEPVEGEEMAEGEMTTVPIQDPDEAETAEAGDAAATDEGMETAETELVPADEEAETADIAVEEMTEDAPEADMAEAEIVEGDAEIMATDDVLAEEAPESDIAEGETEFVPADDTETAAVEEGELIEEDPVTEMAETEMEMVEEETADLAPEIVVDGYTRLASDAITVDDLTGASVYGSDEERVGEVSELLLDDSGAISQAIVDVGGFLGLGEHSVAVDLQELNIQRSEAGDDLRVYVGATEEQLEALPEYEGQ
ncbi:PRC-barrel domain-containing protein [Tranquillimonas alkanivorans]|uniref:PRC-barrel domain-containing protein n=1 Tax=Tranquillimonas alkanivorans TaxID=441119 RepID=A0A1I5QPM0_9RHOB|nr:PRC-barrel domain-containing protein [Tranquillimonas alkanivorans]SFP48258.1 PRC-barrel domain-containing protein [Tranquillimonas alkanivorans]